MNKLIFVSSVKSYFYENYNLYFSPPIGAEGPECVGHLDHSRGDLSDLITREALGLI